MQFLYQLKIHRSMNDHKSSCPVMCWNPPVYTYVVEENILPSWVEKTLKQMRVPHIYMYVTVISRPIAMQVSKVRFRVCVPLCVCACVGIHFTKLLSNFILSDECENMSNHQSKQFPYTVRTELSF